jgi:2-keto-3-deoxy-L-rhamnonate aldolase RhmA
MWVKRKITARSNNYLQCANKSFIIYVFVESRDTVSYIKKIECSRHSNIVTDNFTNYTY